MAFKRPVSKRSCPTDEDEDFVVKPSKKRKTKMPSTVRIQSVETIACAVRQLFESKADPARAAQMNRYMRDQFNHFGLQAPVRRALYPEAYSRMKLDKPSSASPAWPPERLIFFIKELWRLPEREMQHFAMDLAEKQRALLFGDLKKAVGLVKFMICEKSWWDTVDMIATHLVGYIVQEHGGRGEALMDAWIQDKNMWIRRSAILHQLSFKGKCNEERLFRFSLKCAHEEEFFIRKAIGWALRQHARLEPVTVKKFVLQHGEKFSTLTKREAMKHLASVKVK